MKQYEITLLIRNNLESELLKETQKKIEDIITEQKGKILETNDVGERELAYPIDHEKTAHYKIMLIECESHNIVELKREVVINHSLLRVLVINTAKESFYVKNLSINKLQIDDESFARTTNNRYFLRKLYYQRRVLENAENEAQINRTTITNNTIETTKKSATTTADK